jgi:hypothetical protein
MTRRRKQGRSKAAIARLDARWFKAHPGRLHRVRLAEEGEVQLPSVLIGRPILMAMRRTGKAVSISLSSTTPDRRGASAWRAFCLPWLPRIRTPCQSSAPRTLSPLPDI